MKQRSNGTVEIKSDPKKDKTVLATINVIDGTNVTVMAQIHTTSVTTGVNFAVLNTMHKPKVFTVAYAHNTTQTRNRKINLGQRQQGDVVLAEQTKNVTLSTRFAEAEFIYKSPNTHITAVSFSFSVSATIYFLFLEISFCLLGSMLEWGFYRLWQSDRLAVLISTICRQILTLRQLLKLLSYLCEAWLCFSRFRLYSLSDLSNWTFNCRVFSSASQARIVKISFLRLQPSLSTLDGQKGVELWLSFVRIQLLLLKSTLSFICKKSNILTSNWQNSSFYQDSTISLIMTNLLHSITLSSLSLQSPTAVAFVNTTFIKEDSLDVIVYDLNSPGFIANMSVYGYHYPKPLGYKSIVLTKPIVGNRN